MEQIFNDGTYRVSDLIKELQEIETEYGDLPVTYEGRRGGVKFIGAGEEAVSLKFMKYPAPRERVLSYWTPSDGSAYRAQMVIEI